MNTSIAIVDLGSVTEKTRQVGGPPIVDNPHAIGAFD